MPKLARLEGGAVAEYPLDLAQARRQKRNVSFPANPPTATLEAHGYAVVEETARPSTGYGETAVEGPPELVDGTWRQTWQVQSITLAEAKQRLAQRAAEIYVQKVTAVTPQQLLQGGYVGAIQARDAHFKPRLDDVAARIQSASTIAEAYAIYQELESYT